VELSLLGHRITPEGKPGPGDVVRVAGSPDGGPSVRLRSRNGRVIARLGG
jgi:hypothetical protein